MIVLNCHGRLGGGVKTYPPPSRRLHLSQLPSFKCSINSSEHLGEVLSLSSFFLLLRLSSSCGEVGGEEDKPLSWVTPISGSLLCHSQIGRDFFSLLSFFFFLSPGFVLFMFVRKGGGNGMGDRPPNKRN